MGGGGGGGGGWGGWGGGTNNVMLAHLVHGAPTFVQCPRVGEARVRHDDLKVRHGCSAQHGARRTRISASTTIISGARRGCRAASFHQKVCCRQESLCACWRGAAAALVKDAHRSGKGPGRLPASAPSPPSLASSSAAAVRRRRASSCRCLMTKGQSPTGLCPTTTRPTPLPTRYLPRRPFRHGRVSARGAGSDVDVELTHTERTCPHSVGSAFEWNQREVPIRLILNGLSLTARRHHRGA